MTTTIKAGDLIKSYDFSKELQPGCYMVGIVESINGNWIAAKIIKQFFDGKKVEMPVSNTLFRTPVQGAGMFDHSIIMHDTRIEMIATAEELKMVMASDIG